MKEMYATRQHQSGTSDLTHRSTVSIFQPHHEARRRDDQKNLMDGQETYDLQAPHREREEFEDRALGRDQKTEADPED